MPWLWTVGFQPCNPLGAKLPSSYLSINNPPASQQRRKRPRGANDATTSISTPPAAQLLTLVSGRPATQPTSRTPQEAWPMSQPTIIGSQVASTSSNPSTKWECTFHLGDKILPSDSYVRTWKSSLGGQVFDSLRKALLLPADLEHYSGYQDKDLILKLK